jgi:hypothetical protein
MIKRISNTWQLWLTLAILWTLVAAASAWLNLPRASGIAHEPGFMSRLSPESSAIVRGPGSTESLPGAPLWADTPRVFRMSNGMQLSLPAVTTDERASIVERNYRDLLEERAGEQRWLYWIERTAVWLAIILIGGYAVHLLRGAGLNSHGIAPLARAAVRATAMCRRALAIKGNRYESRSH